MRLRAVSQTGPHNTVRSVSVSVCEPFCCQSFEILQDQPLEASGSYFAASASNYSKINLWKRLGAILRPELGNTPRSASGSVWERFSSQCLEILQDQPPGASGSHFAASVSKYSKISLWKRLGAILQPEFQNTPRSASGTVCEPFCSQCFKILQDQYLAASVSHFAARALLLLFLVAFVCVYLLLLALGCFCFVFVLSVYVFPSLLLFVSASLVDFRVHV